MSAADQMTDAVARLTDAVTQAKAIVDAWNKAAFSVKIRGGFKPGFNYIPSVGEVVYAGRSGAQRMILARVLVCQTTDTGTLAHIEYMDSHERVWVPVKFNLLPVDDPTGALADIQFADIKSMQA